MAANTDIGPQRLECGLSLLELSGGPKRLLALASLWMISPTSGQGLFETAQDHCFQLPSRHACSQRC